MLALGFGTLGARIARALRATGCRVTVVDTDTLALVRAAEEGFDTSRSAREALLRTRPS
ncbi:NAD-binding protein [Streptomyces nogalater]